jgi:ABC-2 type transport system permease protein
MWSLRITLAKLRPLNAAAVIKLSITTIIVALFLYGDFVLFQRLFRAVANIERSTPFFALGLLRNVLALAFLVAVAVLFSSSMTAAIGAFFTDLDLETYHASPLPKWRIVMGRWGKTFVQSATIIYVFLIPMFVAFANQYHVRAWFFPVVLIDLGLLLAIPVTLGSVVIIALVRYFPVQRVHQIVASLGILVLSVAVVAFRMSRPERFFMPIGTDDLARALQAIELPTMERYPGTALADLMVAVASAQLPSLFPVKIVAPAVVVFIIFLAIATPIYFRAFVRARESMAPAAIGAGGFTRVADWLLRPFDPPTRAMIGKEVRTLTRDVAQWSQLFLMAALLFLYLYNIRMLPLGGDARAPIIAYANLGMAGFIISAICLRFAYPSISSEGKAFWILQTAPVSYRRLLISKVVVYSIPLTALSLMLTAFANLILHADAVVWVFTLIGASLLATTLVSLGVGLGALAPNFGAENPLQVGLSLGGFGYMAAALAYVGAIMMLMARPVVQYFFWRLFALDYGSVLVFAIPIAIAIAGSICLIVAPLLVAEKRLAAPRAESL